MLVAWTLLNCSSLRRQLSQEAGADLILYHGKIFTADPNQPWVEAIAIRGERIVAAGSDAVIAAFAGKDTRTIDLNGHTAIPGINDAHDHIDIPFGAKFLADRSPMLDPTLPEVMDAVRSLAPRTPAKTWLYGTVGVRLIQDESNIRKALDGVAPDHPVLLFAWWGHGAIINSKGLHELGFHDGVSDPPGGWYERDINGHLTGKLEEYAAWRVLRHLQSNAPYAEVLAQLRRYAEDRLAFGVTSVQIMTNSLEPDLVVRAFSEAGLPIRVRAVKWPMTDPNRLPMDVSPSIARQLNALTFVSGTKWVLDGTPIEQLAFRKQLYESRSGWHGRLNFAPETIRAILAAALLSDDQLLFHVVGDATSDVVLSEMEAMAPPDLWRPRRVRLEHANGITGEQIERARRLGIVIAQPRPSAPLRRWIDAGIPVAYGSDMARNPFISLSQYVSAASGNAVSRVEAVLILTRASAYAEFAEQKKGTLSPGMLADVAVLSQDVFTVPLEALPQTRSILTIVNGQVAYEPVQ